MKSVYLFDVDGTLTPPTKKMDEEFIYFFLEWSKDKHFFLVGGSPYNKIKRQVPFSVFDRCGGVFSSMANELHIDDKLVYSHDWKPSTNLLSKLLEWRMKSPYSPKNKTYLESRVGMLNFSIAGRDSNDAQRKQYFNWDKLHGEREKISNELSEDFPHLDIRLGGMISLDIQPKGRNKSQSVKWIRSLNKYDNLSYFGDKGFKGGNDYDVKLAFDGRKGEKFYDVKDCDDTKKILLSL